ncbi:MAG: cupin domain-containing protein [Actinomycetota bacterium]
MTVTTTTPHAADNNFVLGETLRPLLTHAMGSAVEVFDTNGPADAGPPPHRHPWEEIYVILSGQLEVTVDGAAQILGPGSAAHVPANAVHSYRNVTDVHFLTITKGDAAAFFAEVASDVEMSPPDIPGVVRVAASHDIEFII